MIILALILAIQADWRHSRVSMGWTFVAASQEVVMFTREGPRQNLHWQRQERREDTNGALSSMSLVEVDCQGGRTRYVQGSYYEKPNLEGSVIDTNSNVSEWRYPAPDTLNHVFFETACR